MYESAYLRVVRWSSTWTIDRLKQEECSQLTLIVKKLFLGFCNAVHYSHMHDALRLHSSPYVLWTELKPTNGFAAFQCLYCMHPQCALHGFSSAVRPIILYVSQSPNCPASSHSEKCARREEFAALVFLCPRLSTQHYNLGDKKGT